MAVEQRLSIVTLGVRDLGAATAFYTALGFTPHEAQSNEHVTFFQLGGIIFGLFGWDALADDAGLPAPTDGFGGVSLAYNTRSKEEADDVMALATSLGATITKPNHDTFWGGYAGYFRDPDGHVWEVAYNPFFPITEDGKTVLPD